MALKNEIGNTYGYLTVIERAENTKEGRAQWRCQCKCGNTVIVLGKHLRSGNTKSCGCYKKENNKKHGLSKSKIYHVYKTIKQRCYNKNNPKYNLYGDKGIKMCDEWKNDFIAFHDWAYANGYDENAELMKCTIDRIDNDGNYEPSNCRWVTMKVQRMNQKKHLEINEICQ